MKVGVTQNIKGFHFVKHVRKVGTYFKKVCVSTCTDLHDALSVLKSFWNRPAPTCIFPENGLLCRSVYLSTEKSLIGRKKEKILYREFTEKTFTDLHGHFDGTRERDVEHTLVTEAKKHGGMAPKFVSPGTVGMPDRIVLLPEGRMGFVELKAPGKKVRAVQAKRHRDLEKLGYRVWVVDNKESAKEVIDAVQGTRVSEES